MALHLRDQQIFWEPWQNWWKIDWTVHGENLLLSIQKEAIQKMAAIFLKGWSHRWRNHIQPRSQAKWAGVIRKWISSLNLSYAALRQLHALHIHLNHCQYLQEKWKCPRLEFRVIRDEGTYSTAINLSWSDWMHRDETFIMGGFDLGLQTSHQTDRVCKSVATIWQGSTSIMPRERRILGMNKLILWAILCTYDYIMNGWIHQPSKQLVDDTTEYNLDL